MQLNLSVTALRSFVAIATEGSMVGAARRVFLTQPALSLQIKRLEELLQVTLLHRRGGRLTLTAEGTTLLRFAREILEQNDRAVRALDTAAMTGPVRVGVVQDFAETLLSGTLAAFALQNPEAQVQVRVAGSQELLALFREGELDLALYLTHEDDAEAIMRVPMQWLGAPHLVERPVLPIGLLEEPCVFRAASIAALKAAGCEFMVVLETQSLSALGAAVEAQMVLTCRTALGLGRGMGACSRRDLPDLPDINLVLQTDGAARAPARRLRQLIVDAVILDLAPTDVPDPRLAVL